MADSNIVASDGQLIRALADGAAKLPLNALSKADGTLIDPATSQLQTTGNASLSAIDGKLPALVAGAVPVGFVNTSIAVSNFPATQPVSAAALPLPADASSETTLAAMSAKIPALGQALAAASTPVVLTAAQIATLTPATSVAATNHTAAKGTTAAADVTSSAASANRQPLDVSIYDPATGNANLWRPDAAPYVASEPTTLLFDNFETLDTVDTWTTGGSFAPAVTLGLLGFPTTTAALSTSFLQSKATFLPPSTVFLRSGMLVSLLAGAETGSKAWFGVGFPAGSPTVALPLTNGVVFEIDDTTGALVGVVYSNSVRGTPVALTRPTDGALHRYAIFYRSSRVYFEIDGVSGTAASIAFPNPAVAKLPSTAGVVNGASILGAQRTISITLMSIADTGRNNTQISDGVLPWRKATVKPASSPATFLDTSLVVQTLVPDVYITGQGAQVTVGNNVLLPVAGSTSTDVSGYKSIGIQIVASAGTYTTGQVTFEGSNDNINFVAIPLYDIASLTANPISNYAFATSVTRYFRGPIPFRYFRARLNIGLAGTNTGVQAFTRLSAESFTPTQFTITQATAGNLNATVAIASGTVTTVTTVGSSTPIVPTQTFTNSAATTNATSTKASAGTLWSVTASNINAAARFLKFYNKASAPTVGTDVPVMVLPIPIGGVVQWDGGCNGMRFGTGIAWALTGLAADSDTTAVSASEHKVSISYT